MADHNFKSHVRGSCRRCGFCIKFTYCQNTSYAETCFFNFLLIAAAVFLLQMVLTPLEVLLPSISSIWRMILC